MFFFFRPAPSCGFFLACLLDLVPRPPGRGRCGSRTCSPFAGSGGVCLRCLCFGAALSLVARSLLSRYRHRCCLSPCGSSRCLLGGGDVIPSGVLAPTGSPCSSPRALRGCGSYPARACPLSVRCGGSSRPAAAFPVAPALCLLAGVIRSVAGYVPIRRSPRPACRGAGRAVACCRLSRVVICLYFSDVVVWGGSSRCGGGVEKK